MASKTNKNSKDKTKKQKNGNTNNRKNENEEGETASLRAALKRACVIDNDVDDGASKLVRGDRGAQSKKEGQNRRGKGGTKAGRAAIPPPPSLIASDTSNRNPRDKKHKIMMKNNMSGKGHGEAGGQPMNANETDDGSSSGKSDLLRGNVSDNSSTASRARGGGGNAKKRKIYEEHLSGGACARLLKTGAAPVQDDEGAPRRVSALAMGRLWRMRPGAQVVALCCARLA